MCVILVTYLRRQEKRRQLLYYYRFQCMPGQPRQPARPSVKPHKVQFSCAL